MSDVAKPASVADGQSAADPSAVPDLHGDAVSAETSAPGTPVASEPGPGVAEPLGAVSVAAAPPTENDLWVEAQAGRHQPSTDGSAGTQVSPDRLADTQADCAGSAAPASTDRPADTPATSAEPAAIPASDDRPADTPATSAEPASDERPADTQPNPDAPVSPEAAADTRAGADGPPTNAALREPDEPVLRLAEAAVFASVTPMTARALSQILPDDVDVAAAIEALRSRYAGRGVELCDIGGGLQFRTAVDLAPQLRKVVQVPRRLPRVALETLAIVAYHQPITRPEIEDLRGTSLSQQTLDLLLENNLIVARGRKETPGRPTLWGTTAKFLEYFGLRDIRELPRRQDLLLEAVRAEAQGEPADGPSEPATPQEEAA